MIGPQYKGGARVWTGFENLPELNLENPAVRDHLWAGADSVVRSYLRDGADGWRLDTAFELGPKSWQRSPPRRMPRSRARWWSARSSNYPGDWLHVARRVMDFTLRQVLLGAIDGEIAPARAARMIDRMTRDAGIEPMLKSWMVLDNHDIQRIATELPDVRSAGWRRCCSSRCPARPTSTTAASSA